MLSHLWQIFEDLADRRQWQVAGSSLVGKPLDFPSVAAYLSLFKIELELWEIRVLFELDDAILPILNKAKGNTKGFRRDDVAGIKANYSARAKKARVKADG